MKTKLKRALSAVLTCAMVLGFMPAIAGAVDVQSTIKVTDAATDAEITNAEITIKDSSETNVTATDGKYPLDTDKTYTFSATATGYEAVDAKTFTPDASEQETFKMNPIFTITYYDHKGIVLGTSENKTGYTLSSAYDDYTTYVYGKGATLPDAEPYSHDGYDFDGWVLKSDTTTAVTTIGTTEKAAIELQASFTESNKPTVTMAATTNSKSVTLKDKAEIPTYGVITVTFPLAVDTDSGTVTLKDSDGEEATITKEWSKDKKTLTVTVKDSKTTVLDTDLTYTLTIADFTTADGDKIDGISFSKLDPTTKTLTLNGATVNGEKNGEFEVPYGLYIDFSESYKPSTSGSTSFNGWYENDSYTGNRVKNITMTDDKTLYASFSYGTTSSSSSSSSSSNSESYGKVYPRLDKTRTGYISGYSDGSIKPKANMTREEVASMFYNMVNSSTISTYGTTENEFTDVASDRWSNAAISTLAKAGVLTGYSDGSFRPSATITRAEFITIITRLESASTAGQAEFSDIDGHWAKDAIMNAYSWGVVTGYSDNTFRPNQNVTRAEAVAMVNRLMGRSVSESSLPSGMKTFTDNQDTTAWYYLDIQVAAN